MSFYRVGPHSKKKTRIQKNPIWDNTVNDLTVHKATPEEIMLRKESHKSKNHIAVKLKKMRTDEQKKKLTGAEAQQLAIMREILYDQQQLENVLAKSDTMMNVVKDLFGDDPKRFVGFPNVTTAPHAESQLNGSSHLVAPVADIYTKTEKLSDSVMNQSALNDFDESDSDEDAEVDRPQPISYESKLNLLRFQEYLQEEEKKSSRQDQVPLVVRLNKNQSSAHSVEPGGPSQETTESALNLQLLSLLSTSGSVVDNGDSSLARDGQLLSLLMTIAGRGKEDKAPPQTVQAAHHTLSHEEMSPVAINNTQKVKKTKKFTAGSTNETGNTTTSMSDIRKVLQDLEIELCEYEHQTDRQTVYSCERTETFSGYTVALVNAVSRLTKYLKETDLRVRTEVTLREQLMQDVYQLKTIIDALATDLIVTQEEYGQLFSDHKKYKDSTEVQITALTKQVNELRLQVFGKESRPLTQNSTGHPHDPPCLTEQQQQQRQKFHDSADNSKKSDDTRTSSPYQSHHDISQSVDYLPLPSLLHTSENAAAVLLSPPVRKTRVYTDRSEQSESSRTGDPPNLTQDPPVMTTVNVPRPVPLVQSNMAVLLPMGSSTLPWDTNHSSIISQRKTDVPSSQPVQENDLTELVTLGERTGQQLKQLDKLSVEESLNTPAMQSLMQEQIQELNQQQEEARRRLRVLLDSQKIQQLQLHHRMRLEGEEVTRCDIDGDYSPISVINCNDYYGKSLQRKCVSPPISPISQQSGLPAFKDTGKTLQNKPGRDIRVSIPMADLDDSLESQSRFEPA